MQPTMASGVRADFDVPATMRDGVVLRANVYRPDDGGMGHYPVLLMRLPYGKDFPLGSSLLNPAHVARRGYIVVVQDVRGTFTSEGDFVPMRNEAIDGADTIAWAASLAGADGAVGMFGGSYMGFTQWAAAREAPPALRAMAPLITWADPNQGVFSRNGVFELGLQAAWLLQRGLDVLSRRHRGNPAGQYKAFQAMAEEFDHLVNAGYAEVPLQHFGPLVRLDLDQPASEGLEHREDLVYQDPATVAPAYHTAAIPMLHIGGWNDIFLAGTLQNFNEMLAAGHAEQYLVIGPWSHTSFDSTVGNLDFGVGSSAALIDLQIDLVSLHLQFFDYSLKHAANGFDRWPRVKYFMMGSNIWRGSDVWPPASMRPQPWYLHSAGHANSARGDGLLSPEPAADEPPDNYVYSPNDPAPTVGGATLMHPSLRSGPFDQRVVEARDDVLAYTTAPLEHPVTLAGPVAATLYVATDGPDTDFVARLVDVYPDGRAMSLTDGVTRLRYRTGMASPAGLVEAGRVYEISIDLWATAVTFLPGHQIRLEVTSSNFPRWERNPNTGEDASTATTWRAARQTVLHDAEHPSHVTLPVLSE
ncbi:MAG TPA: CocE/NonD family hydrolase [Ktedonobacterales bacterium]|nr:CocE/NonD family hydrolase [Ktedonobacterales bacterium]